MARTSGQEELTELARCVVSAIEGKVYGYDTPPLIISTEAVYKDRPTTINQRIELPIRLGDTHYRMVFVRANKTVKGDNVDLGYY